MKQKHQRALPRSAWEGIVINENNDPLVLLKETKKLKIGWIKKSYDTFFYLRKSVAEMLYRVSENLPDGMVLVIIEGYRTIESQQFFWDSKWKKLKEENSELSDEEIEKLVRMVVAKPSPLANHHCGGAVDVTIGFEDGTMLDMGSPYPNQPYGIDMQKKFPMHSEYISEQQSVNRTILREVMESAGFVWYPGEWWHYCYGDRMWAVYTGRTECFYGPVELTV